jgi:hypothetical protein
MDLGSALRSAKESVPFILMILEQTVQTIDGHEATSVEMRHFLSRSLLRAGQILDSASLLAEKHRYQDVWVLGRTLAELSINICYLQIASPDEFSRWSNYDLWTDERLISNLAAEIPILEDALDPRELEQQRRVRKHLEDKGLYAPARRGSWSERSMDERAKSADVLLGLAPNVLYLLYRLAVKLGDGFVHSSPRAIGAQSLAVSSLRQPTAAEVQATTQALSMAATSVTAALMFTRKRFGLSMHLLDERVGDLLRNAYAESYIPSK